MVRGLSTGKPEIQNYPFTTRTIITGHITDAAGYDARLLLDEQERPFQILDTPGVLRRDEEAQRNAMEQLTLASINVLDSVVVYVVDMSGFSQPVGEQLEVWEHMKSLANTSPSSPSSPSSSPTRERRWIDVVSKSDLLDPVLVPRVVDAMPGALHTSSETGVGVPDLHAQIMAALRSTS